MHTHNHQENTLHPKFYQQTYPTYESMGVNVRDMQRGTVLVFGLELTEF